MSVNKLPLTRTQGENLFSLTGRVELWQIFTGYKPGVWEFLIGIGPGGENNSKLVELAASSVRTPSGTFRVQHAHNLFLSLIYSNGLLGVVIAAVLLWVLAQRVLVSLGALGTAASWANAILVIGVCCIGSVESLFNPYYIYFVPMCILLVLELLVEGREHALSGTRWPLRPKSSGTRNPLIRAISGARWS